jgi:hypothetical protein
MKDWKDLIAAVAPTIATALGGPVAGLATRTLSQVLLGHESGSEADISDAMGKASPETLLKIKEADQAFQVNMKTLDINLEQIAANDRDSARSREVNSNDSTTLRILASLIVGGFLGCIWFVLSGHVQGLTDPMTAGMIGTLIGYLSAKADQVVSYYFGSSAGSAKKTQAMTDALNIQVKK